MTDFERQRRYAYSAIDTRKTYEWPNGKRLAVTGSTGFLGTALVERLLRSAPGCELSSLEVGSR